MLDAQFIFLCPGKPTVYMIVDVVDECICVDSIFVVAPIGKRQNCTVILELIRDTFSTARMLVQVRLSWRRP